MGVLYHKGIKIYWWYKSNKWKIFYNGYKGVYMLKIIILLVIALIDALPLMGLYVFAIKHAGEEQDNEKH